MNITVKFNNETHEFPQNTSLEGALNILKVQLNGIAVAVNNSIVTKTEWANVQLKSNDTILVITATQGG